MVTIVSVRGRGGGHRVRCACVTSIQLRGHAVARSAHRPTWTCAPERKEADEQQHEQCPRNELGAGQDTVASGRESEQREHGSDDSNHMGADVGVHRVHVPVDFVG
jgi:hypothetical protein